MQTKECIQNRRTIRRFKQQKVSENEIKELLNAARLASCGGNLQRLRYLVIQSQDLVEKAFKDVENHIATRS